MDLDVGTSPPSSSKSALFGRTVEREMEESGFLRSISPYFLFKSPVSAPGVSMIRKQSQRVLRSTAEDQTADEFGQRRMMKSDEHYACARATAGAHAKAYRSLLEVLVTAAPYGWSLWSIGSGRAFFPDHHVCLTCLELHSFRSLSIKSIPCFRTAVDCSNIHQ
ncbi:hypothetical protein RvY_15862 [Ramazzottius varieornatus]|uniref:Uncharacterized protein n=1 Tax=Ramazzottius varieornatus TaxID=947166 RepID=A0A1D1VXV4_RAMVA|nr:hypothetical protein RvY_15862 [Ramazzottius varieornatus]